MKWYKDDFDSKLLEQDVYKFHLDVSTTKEEIEASLARIPSGIIFCFVPAHTPQTTCLEEHLFHFVSIRHTYVYGGNAVGVVPTQNDMRITPFSADQKLPDEDLHSLALTVGQETRYFKDPYIPRHISEHVYDTWVKNSLYNGLASQSFIAWSGDRAIGICTTKLHENEGEIDLLGVLPEFRTKKIGKQLVEHAVNYLQMHDAQHITVVTSGENIPANIFFQKHMFYIKEVHLVYHKHL